MARRFSMPILFWVVAGLAVVGALPFAVAWYQIDRNADDIIDQIQRTHQIVAKTSADQTRDYLAMLNDLVASAGDDPRLYLEPNSADAQLALERLLVARPEIEAVGLFAWRDEKDITLVSLRRSGSEVEIGTTLADRMTAPPTIIDHADKRLLRIQVETSRPDVFIALLAEINLLEDYFAPPNFGRDAEIALIDSLGEPILGQHKVLDAYPELFLEKIQATEFTDGMSRFKRNGLTHIVAFARLPEHQWTVVSAQPAHAAEKTLANMRQTAWTAFGLVALVVGLLAIAAHHMVIRPLRGLVRAQQRLAGNTTGETGGSEIAQLQEAFQRLESSMTERETLSQIFLDRYQVVRCLGAGAMGTVYLGWDPKLERHVALKTIRLDEDLPEEERDELTQGLVKEGLLAAKLTHPNIVTVFDVLQSDKFAFVVMEYVDGEPLDSVLDREGALSASDVMNIGEGLLKALKLAHEHGVIHRDIKPPNILIAKDGTVKVSDFGIAGVLNRTGDQDDKVIRGTPGYIAPESYKTAEFSEQSDLFAVGVVIAECLTGHQVFTGKSTMQIITRTTSKDVKIPEMVVKDLPSEFLELLDSLLAKDPNERPAGATEALDLLLGVESQMGMDDEQAGKKERGYSSAATVKMDIRHTTRLPAGGELRSRATQVLDPDND